MPELIPMPRATEYADRDAAEAAGAEFEKEFHELVVKYGLLGNLVGYTMAYSGPNGDPMMLGNSGCMGANYVLKRMAEGIVRTANHYVANDDGESERAYDFPEEVEG